MRRPIVFQMLDEAGSKFWWLLAVMAALTGAGIVAAIIMEHHGHYLTGMNNHVVWGLPHIFAVFLIVSASGALNVAALSSVLGKTQYQALARLSGVLALSLLIGGLGVILLDLGRPDRLIVAFTHYNFKSVFAWNIIFYTGFAVLALIYLMTMFTPSWGHSTKKVGLAALIWRLFLTSATASIFGLLFARDAYIALLMVPFFISASLALGTAIFILVFTVLCHCAGRQLDLSVINPLARLNAILVGIALVFALLHHLTNWFIPGHETVAKTILLNGGAFTIAFWLGQVLLGALVPVWLYLRQPLGATKSAVLASILVVIGGLIMIALVILVPQVLPLDVLPGYEVSSSFSDGVLTPYRPTWLEWLLGVGGVGFSIMATMVATRVLPVLPRA